LKDGHRDDLNNFKFINIKQSKYTLNDEWVAIPKVL
jgi:hypothetical protein